MSMAYIRATYKVPAKRGARVRLDFVNARKGTITSACGHYLKIRLDKETRTGFYHPVHGLTYL